MENELFASLDVTGQAELVATGEATALELVNAAIERIEKVDPVLNALTYRRFEEAREEAAALPQGRFAGVPILLKDLGAAAKDHPAHSGNATLKELGVTYDHDSYVVQRLRSAGFIVLGRTNVAEFGLVSDTDNPAFGATRNPWDTERSPGGSSGGSGAAVAAGMVAVAHGTDGGGSVRIPSAMCGLVGLKTSRGLISDGPGESDPMFGYVTNGVLTRSVRDQVAMLDVLAGPGAGDPVVAPRPAAGFGAALNPARRLRIGVVATGPSSQYPTDPALSAAVEQVASVLSTAGHTVKDAYPEVMFDERFWFEWMNFLSPLVPIIVDDIEAQAEAAGVEARFDIFTDWWNEHGRRRTAIDHTRTHLWMDAFRRQMAAWWYNDGYDVLLSPVLTWLPPKSGHFHSSSSGLMESVHGLQYTPQFNGIGAPAITVPGGWDTTTGLPLGIQFAGRYGEDSVLLSLAAEFEKLQPWATRYRTVGHALEGASKGQ